MSDLKYKSFDDFLEEVECFGFRWERLESDFEIFDKKKKEQVLLWCKACWDAARETKDEK